MKFLLVSSLIAWWLKRPNSRFQKFVLAAASLATFWVIAPIYAQLCLAWSVHYTREGIRYWSLDELLVRHASMLVTLAAVIWSVSPTRLFPSPPCPAVCYHFSRYVRSF